VRRLVDRRDDVRRGDPVRPMMTRAGRPARWRLIVAGAAFVLIVALFAVLIWWVAWHDWSEIVPSPPPVTR
jgi:hypothetical protein